MISIKDIAKLAGVSYSTVSKALNDSPLVKPSTKRHILEIAERHGYQKNLLATQLASGRSKLVGLVLNNLSNPVFVNIANDLRKELVDLKYQMLLAISPDGVDLFNQLRVEGIIVWGDLVRDCPEMLRSVSTLRVPRFVLGTDESLAIPHVLIDRRAGIHAAVRYLTTYGHRRIAFVGDSQEIKVHAFEEAVRDMGLEFSKDYLIPAESTWEGGYRAIKSYKLGTETSPTAFIGVNNLLTKGMLRGLLEMGYSVPEDISVIGYDNLPDMQNAEVPITTVGPSLEEMTKQSARLMATLIEDPNHAYPVVLQPTLIERASVAQCHDIYVS